MRWIDEIDAATKQQRSSNIAQQRLFKYSPAHDIEKKSIENIDRRSMAVIEPSMDRTPAWRFIRW